MSIFLAVLGNFMVLLVAILVHEAGHLSIIRRFNKHETIRFRLWPPKLYCVFSPESMPLDYQKAMYLFGICSGFGVIVFFTLVTGYDFASNILILYLIGCWSDFKELFKILNKIDAFK